MQLSADTTLATYLAQTSRNLQITLLIDWDFNNYGSSYADMSSLWEEIAIERSFTGNVPDEINLLEGYSVAQMTVKLSGKRIQDTMPLKELLAPWSPTSPFTTSKLNCPIKCYVTAPLDTPRVMNQFVGVIREITTGLDDEVTITALDLMYALQSGVFLRPTGVDYSIATFGSFSTEAQSFNSVWAIDQVLRQCGLYNSPAPMKSSATITPYFCATLNGSFFPEANSNAVFISILATVTSPDAKFIAGKYGYAANGTSTKRSRYLYQITPTAMDYPVKWVKGETQQAGGWVFGPQACVNNQIIIFDATLSGDPDLAGLCAFELYLSNAGVVTCRLRQLTGQSYTVTFTGPTIAGPAAWHYIGVGLTWRTSDSGVTATFNVDGAITTVSNATVLLAFTAFQVYSSVRLESNMPVQHVQWWKTNSASLVWPKDPPAPPGLPSPQTQLSLGLLSQTQIPDIYGAKGIDTLSAIVEAEYGVIYSTEDGLIRFLNRDQVLTERIPANNFILTPADLKTLKVHDRDDSFRNKITATSTLNVLIAAVVFQSDRVETFDTPASTTKDFVVPIDGVQRLGLLNVPFVTPWAPDTTTHGFYVIKTTDGTVPAGVTVGVALIDHHNLLVRVANTSAFTVRLSTSGATPVAALHIGGYNVIELTANTTTYQSSASITALGRDQILPLDKSDWRSHQASLGTVANSLLTSIAYPIPVIDPVEVRGDPRRQLNDTATLSLGNLGTIETAVIGITRTFKKGDEPIVDKLILQPTTIP